MKSPLVSLMLLPFLAAEIRAGSWARTPNIRSQPTAVRTLLSMMPIGGSKKPPMISRRLIAKLTITLTLTITFFSDNDKTMWFQRRYLHCLMQIPAQADAGICAGRCRYLRFWGLFYTRCNVGYVMFHVVYHWNKNPRW